MKNKMLMYSANIYRTDTLVVLMLAEKKQKKNQNIPTNKQIRRNGLKCQMCVAKAKFL